MAQEPIIREITDKEMAIHLIEGMNNRTTLRTIINRLKSVESAVELAGMMVADKILDEPHAVEWLIRLIKSYETQK